MKHNIFAKVFNTFMSKYSYAMLVKLFENLNFKLIMKTFLESEGFRESLDSTQTMIENREAYTCAAQSFLDLWGVQNNE